AGWQDALPTFEQGTSMATRVAIEKAFNASLDGVPSLVAGAADLTGNTGTKLAGQTAQSAAHPDGRQVYYGVREHGMGAAMVGMALHGGVLPAGGTFFVFLDYMRPAVRLAALKAFSIATRVAMLVPCSKVGRASCQPARPVACQVASHSAGSTAAVWWRSCQAATSVAPRSAQWAR
ncbi:MAG: hypothetical protein ACK5CE_10105, partial [Actinomycetes bacterium]